MPPWTAWTQLAFACRIVRPVEVDVSLPQQRMDNLDRLLEPAGAVVPGIAKRVELGPVPAGAEAEDQPARR